MSDPRALLKESLEELKLEHALHIEIFRKFNALMHAVEVWCDDDVLDKIARTMSDYLRKDS